MCVCVFLGICVCVSSFESMYVFFHMCMLEYGCAFVFVNTNEPVFIH